MSGEHAFPLIADWTREGRARLVADSRDVLHELARSAFEALAAPLGEERFLAEFGFATLDDAADWVLERFATMEIDPERLSTRTWRLFTAVKFWLAQRASAAGARRKLAALHRPARLQPTEIASDHAADPALAVDLERFAARLGASLRTLGARTCADLVAWWLRGTERIRSEWFQFEATPDTEPSSKKRRSEIVHDALFRFLCIHRDLVPAGSRPDEVAVRAWLFTPCPNRPPYRGTVAEVAAALSQVSGGAPRTREVQDRCRDGVLQLLFRALEALPPPPDRGDRVAELARALHLRSLGLTTLTAFELDEGRSPRLEERIRALREDE